MKYKVEKLDARYKGYWYFKYAIAIQTDQWDKPSISRLENFLIVRNWCVDTWGLSCERENFLTIKSHEKDIKQYNLNMYWCWHDYDGNSKIYLAGDSELMIFDLKWR